MATTLTVAHTPGAPRAAGGLYVPGVFAPGGGAVVGVSTTVSL